MKKIFFVLLVLASCAFFSGLSYSSPDTDTGSADEMSDDGPGIADGEDASDGVASSRKASGFGAELVGKTFRIKANDVVFIRLHGDEEGLDTPGLRVRVSSDGIIKYPYIGEVKVAGMTEEEVAAKLEGLLGKRIMQEPQVTVVLEERLESIMRSMGYYRILGQVKRPGKYLIISDENAKVFAVNRFLDAKGANTVLDAVTMAGGFSDFAYTNGVKVRRIVNGKTKYFRVPVGYIYKTGNLSRNVNLEDGDVIVVPQTWY